MIVKNFFIFIITFFISILSLCSEQKNITAPYTILPIKAKGIVCLGNYAVINEHTKDNRECYIYDLIAQKKLKTIMFNHTYEIAKHPHEPLVAITVHPSSLFSNTVMGIYTIPEGEQKAALSQKNVYSPIFRPDNTTIMANNDKSFIVFDYQKNHIIKDLTQSIPIPLTQCLKTVCNQNFFDKLASTSQEPMIDCTFDGIFNVNQSLFTFTYGYGEYSPAIYNTSQKTVIVQQKKIIDPILSTVFHPVIPHIMAILSTKEQNFRYILVRLFNIKTQQSITIIDKELDEITNPFDYGLSKSNRMDFFNKGKKLIVSLVTTCIIFNLSDEIFSTFNS